ncbi:MAG: hypothetical protein ER33_12855 [Cyanobium sp. CACIAM 14]|nr:MAG: hypothetical protein ER33_12855 [Cyanobium sp. CACIAM 14]
MTALGGGAANLLSFLIAFAFSFKAQQVFTFKDRLGTQQLNLSALILIFLFNAGAALTLGALLQGRSRLLLPLLPAAINYVLFYVTSGLALFRN